MLANARYFINAFDIGNFLHAKLWDRALILVLKSGCLTKDKSFDVCVSRLSGQNFLHVSLILILQNRQMKYNYNYNNHWRLNISENLLLIIVGVPSMAGLPSYVALPCDQGIVDDESLWNFTAIGWLDCRKQE